MREEVRETKLAQKHGRCDEDGLADEPVGAIRDKLLTVLMKKTNPLIFRMINECGRSKNEVCSKKGQSKKMDSLAIECHEQSIEHTDTD